MDWQKLKYFSRHEFDSPDAPGSGDLMDYEFIKKLELIRLFIKEPVIINSGYRSAERNAMVGGVKDSAHRTGNAADIRCTTSQYRCKLINTALIVGIKRIGIGNNYVHLDNDKTKVQNVIWVY